MLDVDLSDEQKAAAQRITNWLKAMREKGLVDADHPATNAVIRARAKQSGVIIKEAEFRKLVHYLRTINGDFICSRSMGKNGSGYWWTDDPHEFDKHTLHLRSRAIECWEARSRPLKLYEQRNNLSLFSDNEKEAPKHHIIEALEREMGAVIIHDERTACNR